MTHTKPFPSLLIIAVQVENRERPDSRGTRAYWIAPEIIWYALPSRMNSSSAIVILEVLLVCAGLLKASVIPEPPHIKAGTSTPVRFRRSVNTPLNAPEMSLVILVESYFPNKACLFGSARAARFFQRRLHQSKCEQRRLILKENLYSMLSGYRRS